MRNVTKTTFFSFIFPTVLYLTAKFQHCSMRHTKVRAELKRATHAQPCCDPILDLTLEMLGNLSFTRRYLINFFIKNLHFFFIEYLFQIYCILSSEWLLKCSSTWFAAVLDMPSRHVEIWSRHSLFQNFHIPCTFTRLSFDFFSFETASSSEMEVHRAL